MESLIGILGIVTLLAIAFFCSNDRKAVPWKTVASGMALQLLFAILVLGIPALGFHGPLKPIFSWLNDAVLALLNFADAGTSFLVGPLGDSEKVGGVVIAFKILPAVIFFSSLVSVLYYLRIMQAIVWGIAWIMQKTMRLSPAESLCVAGNVFLGQTEAPLLVKPYVASMTRSEIFAVMTGGMATVAGGTLAAYTQLLKDRIPDIAGHLIAASVMSAPAAIVFAKIMVPERDTPQTSLMENIKFPINDANVIDAAAKGAADGMKLAINIAAMLIAFIALVALLNSMIASIGSWTGLDLGFGQELSLEVLLGTVFTPLAFLLGIPASDAFKIGQLFGEKIVLNEFVAYLSLTKIAQELSDKSVIIASYALCGFANLSSIAIQIGGIGSLAPEQRKNLSELGLRSIVAGSLAAFMTAAIAGLLL